MQQYLNPAFVRSQFVNMWQWITRHALSGNTYIEVAVIVASLIFAYILARPLRTRLKRMLDAQKWSNRFQGRLINILLQLLNFIFAILLLHIGSAAVTNYQLPTLLIDTAARLLTAWIIIRATTALLRDSKWARLLSLAAWFVAALHILNLLVPTIETLDQLAIDLGGVRISVLLLIKGVFLFTVLFKLSSSLSNLMEKRISSLSELTPSVQVLLTKAFKFTLIAVVVMVALSSLGIDLSAFAFFGGAIGLGVGFGLQKVVSNLISGVILLLDKSIKPGDVIEVGESYGKIESLGARYVSVATRDGYEYLIPNEDLITQQVINWSFSNRLVRLKIGVGVSYDTDIHKAMDLIIQAARNTNRVLDNPKPVCQLKNFGDNSVDLELRIWIEDPDNGVANVGSAVRLAIWDAFKQHGIEIPFPQRDIHIKSSFNSTKAKELSVA